jgi:hypothetical protein
MGAVLLIFFEFTAVCEIHEASSKKAKPPCRSPVSEPSMIENSGNVKAGIGAVRRSKAVSATGRF